MHIFQRSFFRMAEVAQPEVTPEAQEEPEVPEEEEIVPINVPILKLIKQQQMEHGLRHRDYNQYRRYCTNRARRLRRFLNFKLGEKRKVTPRKITPWEIKQNVQFIINTNRYKIRNPNKDIKVTILQNDQWDNSKTILKSKHCKVITINNRKRSQTQTLRTDK